ncbi:MAG: hypothetical protein AAF583_01640 [Pseudomonadota bacterium]
MNLVYSAAAIADIDEILPSLRDADREEVGLMSRWSVRDALIVSVTRAPAYTVRIDGNIAAIFGAPPASVVTDSATPWIVSTDVMTAHPLVAARHNWRIVETWKKHHRHLFNYVHAGNALAIKWLKWLGFTLHDEAPYGPYNAPFRQFEWTAS